MQRGAVLPKLVILAIIVHVAQPCTSHLTTAVCKTESFGNISLNDIAWYTHMKLMIIRSKLFLGLN